MAEFHTALAEVIDAIKAGDFAAAWKWFAVAEFQQDGLSVESGIGNGTRNTMRQSLERSEAVLKAAEVAVARSNRRGLITTRTNFNR